ncbi:UNVERIFIED_CONTAM: hypothetical protein GTU68_038338 [Idotea baltica]|nr:hypothetical protein [Idotea baltica]
MTLLQMNLFLKKHVIALHLPQPIC